MNRALIWKEFREQGLIVAALVILGGGVLVAAGLIFPASSSDSFADMRKVLDPKMLAIVLLVLASGIVVGGTLFAGEREQGTFSYLELLPVPRWRVWLGKVLAGLVLMLVATGLLFAVAAAVGVVGPPEKLPFWALITFTLSIAAFSWGTLGSAYAKTSLAACGLGLLATMPLTLVIYPICAIAVQVFDRVAGEMSRSTESAIHSDPTIYGTLFGLVIVPLALSAWIYTSPDRNRFARDVRTARGGPVDPVRRRRRLPRFTLFPKLGLRASLWAVARQNLRLTLVLCGIAVVSGLSLLQPSIPVLFVWPVTTLMLGTIVGVTGWSDEQNSGAFRFWAERRMPVGRLWFAKVGYGWALVSLLLVLLALPSLIAARAAGSGEIMATAFRTRLFLDRDFPIAEYLWLWPAYGFAFGHLAGMLFRKAAVGTAVGVMTGGAIVGLWLPSLLSGGIHWYQLWLPPLLALATARALVWSWALDQLGQGRALLRLASGSAAIVLAMSGGILYRMLEIPEDANSEADIAFRATIPPFETNDAGREIRRGAILHAEMLLSQRRAAPDEPLWAEGPSQQYVNQTPNQNQDLRATYLYQLDDVLHLGWPANRPDADAWLDAGMANGWADLLVNSSRMPLGTVEDPSEMTGIGGFKHLNALRDCEAILLARGLQLQAKGHPEAFVESVAASLSVARNLRNKSFYICGLVGQRIETRTHLAIQRWLEKLGDRPDLLKELLELIRAHDATCPRLGVDGNLPEQVAVRNSVNAPSQFIKQYHLQQPVRSRENIESDEALENETEFVAFAWAVPWEKERLRRLVGLGNGRAISRKDGRFFQGLPGFEYYALNSAQFAQMTRRFPDLEREEFAGRRASMLLLALRLHRAEKGALPAKLESLVPMYLPAVPLDPYDDRPFRYRVSEGETIQMELVPAPIRGKPETFAALLGGPAYGHNGNMSDFFDYTAAHLNGCGALLGGLGHELERDPIKYYRVQSGISMGSMSMGSMGSDGTSLPPVIRMLELPAGRGILWSIGPDKLDDAGKRLVVPSGEKIPSGDLIYPVPEPAETKR